MSHVSDLPRQPGVVLKDLALSNERRNAFEHRLDDGYQRIDQALSDGADVRAWEDFWIQLLHEYETVCDELGEAA